MSTSWMSKTSSEVLNFVFKQMTGEHDEQASSSLDVLSKGNVWIKDLPTNNVEPIEESFRARKITRNVGVFIYLFFHFCTT